MTPTSGTGPRPTRSTPIQALWARHGTNTIGERGWLTYAYVPSNEDFTQRYLIVHEISLVPHAAPQIAASAHGLGALQIRRRPAVGDSRAGDRETPEHLQA